MAVSSPAKTRHLGARAVGRTHCRLDRPSSGAGARSSLGLSAVQAPCALNALPMYTSGGKRGLALRCSASLERALFEAASELPRALRPSEGDPA